ncbi:tyrosine-type recombinase/integrase [Alteromonas macleodii]|uniref:tyrosine-type recombinase/integrase n=1 Tax=Alteromonas macleodii TaxID=28108 RepID=UPI0031409C1F
MAKQLARQDIDDTLYVFLQDNSKKWYARFQLFGKWHCKSTRQTDKDEAVAAARLLRMEWKIKAEAGVLTQSKRFRDVAEEAINRMKNELANKNGKQSYKDYINALNKYHIPFFDRTYITSINQDKISEFNSWRKRKVKAEQKKDELAKSTILNHNAAMQRVFAEAVRNKWMTVHQIPVLSSQGASGVRRAAFTPDEYERIVAKLGELIQNSRKQVTRDIRQLLYVYMEFALHSGIRPGTELDTLTWDDIQLESHEHKTRFFVTVRRGKTVKHTGIRQVVCKQGIFDAIHLMTILRPNRKANDLFFTLPNGEETKELSRTFTKILEDCDLKDSPHGKRSLYSLRHTYITWELIAQSVSIDVLARQCGTSIQMIEQHYSHVVPRMFSDQLSGVEIPMEPKKINDRFNVPDVTKAKFAKMAKQWERNYRERGCI